MSNGASYLLGNLGRSVRWNAAFTDSRLRIDFAMEPNCAAMVTDERKYRFVGPSLRLSVSPSFVTDKRKYKFVRFRLSVSPLVTDEGEYSFFRPSIRSSVYLFFRYGRQKIQVVSVSLLSMVS